jgi:hypothetical protein
MPDPKAVDPSSWSPTPTQEENDLAASGLHVDHKEDDGSPVDENIHPPGLEESKKKKQVQADQPTRGGYQTRQVRPEQPRTPATPSHPPPLSHPHSDDK